MATTDMCDLCGLTEPLVMHGTQRLNVPCTHSVDGNQQAAEQARLALAGNRKPPPVNLHSAMRGRGW
jgi:hypothetical protein